MLTLQMLEHTSPRVTQLMFAIIGPSILVAHPRTTDS